LHFHGYQHKVCKGIELMLADSLIEAGPFIRVLGKSGAIRNLADCSEDFHAYWKLNDNIINYPDDEVSPARAM
jgi:hypothetical protein